MLVSDQSWQLFLDKTTVDEDGCWLWTGATVKGYGKLKRNGKYYRAHKWAWEALNGAMPEGIVARHKCDKSLCVNPNCIEPGTQQQNVDDMVERGRHARHSVLNCPECGGEFTQYRDRRRCLECRRRKYSERKDSS